MSTDKTYEDGFADGMRRGLEQAAEGDSAGEGDGRKPLTREAIEAMSHEEIIERKAEIDAFMAGQS
jgi:hypothetical protein